MAKWYAAHSFNPADDSAVQNIPDPGDYTDLVTDDICIAFIDNVMHMFTYDSTDSTTEAVPNVITPTGNAGNGRWLLQQSITTHIGGFPTPNLENPPTDSTISFTDGTRTFSIQPTGSDFTFYVNGTQHVSTGDTVVITDVEGLHWIYFDSDGDLKVQAPGGSTDDLILTKCLVGNVYWDAVNNEGILVGDERHGTSMSPATHYHLHEVMGAKWETGLSLTNFDIDGSGNDATAAQFDVADGEIHDEDIEVAITDGSPQQLVNATIPTFYRLGVGGLWRKLDATANFPVADGTIGDRLDWNDINGGTWQLQEVTNNRFTLTHYFATNDIDTPVIGIMGQAVYLNANLARTGAETEISSISLAGLPGAEYVPIATVIWQTNDTYSNQVAARLISTDLGDDYIDWRTSEIIGSGSSTVDHESLANLFGGGAGDHFHLTEVQHDELLLIEDSVAGVSDGIELTSVDGDTGETVMIEAFDLAAHPTKPNPTSGIWVASTATPTFQYGIHVHPTTGDTGTRPSTVGASATLQGYPTAAPTAHVNMVIGNPDAGVSLYYQGLLGLYCDGAGIQIVDTVGNDPSLRLLDSAQSEVADFMSFNGDVHLDNRVASGLFNIRATNVSVALTTLFSGNPNAETSLYYTGIKALSTTISGIDIYDTSGVDVLLYFKSSAGVDQGLIEVNNGGFILYDTINSDLVLASTPGAGVDLHYGGTKKFETTNDGIQIGNGTADGIGIFHAADDAYFENYDPAGNIFIVSRNAADSASNNILVGNPDGECALYYGGVKSLGTIAGGGIAVGTSVASGESMFYSSDDFYFDNADPGGNTYIRNRNAANSAYHIAFTGVSDGASSLYFAGVKKLETTSVGIKVGDGIADGCVMYFAADDFYIGNKDPAGAFVITVRNAADTSDYIGAVFYADAGVHLYYNNIVTLQVRTGGMQLNNVALDRECVQYWSSNNFVFHAAATDANTTKLFFYVDDGGAAEIGLIINGGADTALYYDNVLKAATLDDGFTVAGCLTLDEITTPTADASHGKIYTKTDNKLYFQDGAGVEHEVAFV